MKAAIYHGQRNVTIEERPVPVCGPKDVLLKTVYASVCGTDAAVWKHGPGTGHRITVGTRAARRAQPKQEETAVVFGAGTIGIAAAIALKRFGCKQVMVCDVSPLRLEKARGLGFLVCNSALEDVKQTAKERFGAAPGLGGPTADVDIYLDAAGADGLLELFQDMGKIGSRMVVVAVAAGKRPVDVLHMTYAQKALIGSGGYFPEDVADVMAIMANGEYDIASIITHEFTQEELPQALELAGHPEAALNVVIRFDA